MNKYTLQDPINEIRSRKLYITCLRRTQQLQDPINEQIYGNYNHIILLINKFTTSDYPNHFYQPRDGLYNFSRVLLFPNYPH